VLVLGCSETRRHPRLISTAARLARKKTEYWHPEAGSCTRSHLTLLSQRPGVFTRAVGRWRAKVKQWIKVFFAGGILALALFGVATPAGPLEDGQSAYQKGDYPTACRFCVR
jgi:hypothetical protein